MTTTHTPGPWTIDTDSEDVHIAAYDAGVVIAYEGNANERDANMYLIAAAPDLLDALQVILAHTEREWMIGTTNETYPENAIANDEPINRVRKILHDTAWDAISKAEGR